MPHQCTQDKVHQGQDDDEKVESKLEEIEKTPAPKLEHLPVEYYMLEHIDREHELGQ